jgi:hypothetical protein
MQCSARQERARGHKRDEIRNKARHLAVPDDDVHAAGIWTATGGLGGFSSAGPRAGSLGGPGSRLLVHWRLVGTGQPDERRDCENPAQLPCSRAAGGAVLVRRQGLRVEQTRAGVMFAAASRDSLGLPLGHSAWMRSRAAK